MSNTVFCKKYQKDLPAMTIPPMPGPKGKEIMETVSLEAWEDWKSHQTTLINEKHLDLSKSEDRSWLLEQMENSVVDEKKVVIHFVAHILKEHHTVM